MNKETIKVAINGYGNLGKAVEKEISKSQDIELVSIFTRRNPKTLQTKGYVPVVSVDKIKEWVGIVDVLIMCGGSATDLPKQVPKMAKFFNTVDSYDTHAEIQNYFYKVNASARISMRTSVISGGWDPGMFSIMRTYGDAIFPPESLESFETFWGKGVSQGHSDAVRRIKGVKDAIQYTIPIQETMERVRKGKYPRFTLTPRQKHLRECFVVAEEGADKLEIENAIITMPNYFSDYDTKVHFITQEELKKNHSKMYHGGFVIHYAETGNGNKHIMEFSLKLDSNPEFTASVLIALARATYRMNAAGMIGAKTVLDIPPAMWSPKSPEELRKELL